MKTLTSTALVTALMLGLAGTANAQRLETRYDRARVVDVDRVYGQAPGRVTQECWNEGARRYDTGYYRDDSGRLYRQKDDGTGGAIVGAIIGGVLGNQVGDGSGRTAATVAGAAIGGKVGYEVDQNNGNRYANNDDYRYRRDDGVVTRCRTVTTSQPRMEGYEVTYVYNGISRRAFMRNNPGRTIPVAIDIERGRRGRGTIVDVRPRGADYVADYNDWRDY